MRLEVFDRPEFLARRFRYRAGEHVTAIGPTGSGKTTLLNELAENTASPELPCISLALKPRDSTMRDWSKRLGHRTVGTWPPSALTTNRHPPGWTLWPKHTFDPDVDDANLHKQCRAAILDSYKRGNRIILADELLALTDLHLGKELVALWTRGRSMGVGLWGGTQRPTHVPTYAYNQAEHIFLHYDPDKRARDRFAEIGGVDPKVVSETVMGLRKHQWLYIRRDGQKMCVVDV